MWLVCCGCTGMYVFCLFVCLFVCLILFSKSVGATAQRMLLT